jgi:septum formation protein
VAIGSGKRYENQQLNQHERDYVLDPPKPKIILASASPRRRELLREAGYLFEVDPSDIEEPPPTSGVSPADYAADLAWRKASTVATRRGFGLILAADTVCSVNGEVLNKPFDRADAERMIRLQEGRDTEVITGLCLVRAEAREWVGAVELSIVRFRPLSDRERFEYLESHRWEGKSGAYGVQNRDPFVEVVRGSFSNVVGLPMERLGSLLQSYPLLARNEDLPVRPRNDRSEDASSETSR